MLCKISGKMKLELKKRKNSMLKNEKETAEAIS